LRSFILATAALAVSSSAFAAELPTTPDPRLTPGAVLTTDLNLICQLGYSKSVQHTSGSLKAEIYREYGIDKRSGHFEVDHLISLELGGADVKANLWPESYDTEPLNAHVKDKLENRLHEMVCHHEIPIEQAQHDIATDWIAAARKYGVLR
jgi:hypothetical protein